MKEKITANKKLIILIVLPVTTISVILLSVYFRKSINTESVEQVDNTEINVESTEDVVNNDENRESINGIPISRLEASFSIDVDNPSAVMGDADYAFVGEVVSEDGTDYLFPVEVGIVDGEMKLPVVGETYIFYAYAQNDGSLLICGPNSNIKMDIPNETQLSDLEEEVVEEVLETSDEYIEAEDALDTQIVEDRERFESIYEEK